MTVHYLTAYGVEKKLSNVMHMQNVDNNTWIATFYNGAEVTLRTDGIEGIYYEDVTKG